MSRLIAVLLGMALVLAPVSPTVAEARAGRSVVRRIGQIWKARIVRPLRRGVERHQANALVRRLAADPKIGQVHADAKANAQVSSGGVGMLIAASAIPGRLAISLLNSSDSTMQIGGIVMAGVSIGLALLANHAAKIDRGRRDTARRAAAEAAVTLDHPALDPTTDEGRANLGLLRRAGLLGAPP